MTSTTTETVSDLAHRLLSTEDTAKSSEVHRLAAFIVDHHEHATFGAAPAGPAMQQTDSPAKQLGRSELLSRIEAPVTQEQSS